MTLSSLRPPLAAWIIVALSALAGAVSYWQQPTGVFFYTPWNWCEGRNHSFGLIYAALLGLAAGASALIAIGCLVARRYVHTPTGQARRAALLQKSLAGLLLFAVALALTPLFQLALPLQPDARCYGRK